MFKKRQEKGQSEGIFYLDYKALASLEVRFNKYDLF